MSKDGQKYQKPARAGCAGLATDEQTNETPSVYHISSCDTSEHQEAFFRVDDLVTPVSVKGQYESDHPLPIVEIHSPNSPGNSSGETLYQVDTGYYPIERLEPTLLTAALLYARVGLSVIPCDLNGGDPVAANWEQYRERIASEAEIEGWFPQTNAIGIVCGAISGGLEVLAIGRGLVYDKWRELVEEQAAELFERLVIRTTPAGGRYVAYRCTEAGAGVTLARDGEGKALFEIVEHVLVEPTSGIETVQGSLLDIPAIAPGERAFLLAVAQTLDEYTDVCSIRVTWPGSDTLDNIPTYDTNYVTNVARLFLRDPDDVIEVRGIGYRGTVSGYFDDPLKLARAVASVDGRCTAIWLVPNPVGRDLLARANNRLVHYAKTTTSDKEVLGRRWLTLDFDPIRPGAISSTSDELYQSLDAGESCAEWLKLNGWPGPLRAMSGNGGHWLYRLPDLPNDKDTYALISDVYSVLGERFSTDSVEFDKTLKNAARPIKLYGTVARKGDHVPELGRVHRRSYLEIPNELPPMLTLANLRSVAGLLKPQTTTHFSGNERDPHQSILAYLSEQGREYVKKDKPGYVYYEITSGGCLTGDHGGTGYGFQVFPSGAAIYHCHHDTCDPHSGRSAWDVLVIERQGDAAKRQTARPPTPASSDALDGKPTWLPADEVIEAQGRGETGDAELLARLYTDRVVFDHGGKEWYLWAGCSWENDRCGFVRRLVVNQVAAQYLHTASIKQREGNNELAKKLAGAAFRLRQRNRISNVLDLATSLPELALTGDEWDSNPWLLGVANGVVDLRNGELRPGRPGDYIRNAIPTTWQGLDTLAPRWERFLSEVFAKDTGLVQFVQRLLGYGVTGERIEHKLAVLWGEGRNGKDTLLETLTHVLGDLASPVGSEVLLSGSRNPNAATPHLYALRFVRIAWVSESDEGARLAASQVKLLTGGGTVVARPLYGNPARFTPQYLLMLVTNFKPHASADDYALWKRLLLIPFSQRFVDNPDPNDANEHKRDPYLVETLKDEAAGILAWLVRGCLDWQNQGLNPPAVVLTATKEYRCEEDTLSEFFNEYVWEMPGGKVKASTLYKGYMVWAKKYGMKPMSIVAFGKRAKKRLKCKKESDAMYYLGVYFDVTIFDEDKNDKGKKDSKDKETEA